MLRRIQLWKRRNDQLREERAQLSQVPPMTLDLRNLRTLTKREINQVFLSRSIDDEWPELSTEIGRIVVIEDMKTPGVNPGDRRALYYLLRALRPRSVLEIGTNVGASTIHIAAAMKR